MELSSSVTTTWNFCTLGSVLGCLIFLLLFNKNDQILNLWASTTTSNLSVKSGSLSYSTPPTTTNSSPPPPKATVVPPPPLSEIPTIISPPLETTVVTPPLDDSNIITSPPPKANNVVVALSPPPQPTVVALSPPPQDTVVAQPLKLSTLSGPPPIANNVTYDKNIRIIESTKNNKVVKKCNMFDGRWVYKPDGKPSYMASQCPFMEEKMSCQRNKRPDMEFEKWSWEANDCDIPLLNGTDMVERLKNKRVIFVGDSLNRNMWESLSCILYSNLNNASSKAHIHFEGAHRRTILKAKDEYNFTVEFFWTPYLVEHNTNHSSGKKVLVLDKLSPNSVSWIGADIMIFNSGMHWYQLPPKKGWELYEYNGKLIRDMPLHIAYKRGMKTWAKWVQKNVDPKKTTLFYRSISTEHLNKQKDQWCYGKTKPMMDDSYVSSFPQKLVRSIEEVIRGMDKSQIIYMNITKMSQYRIDAHPSIYRYNDWKTRAQNDLNSLKSTADCGHWCLPGVPDTWNRILYANIL